MIHANRIVTVGEQECIIDRPIVLYRGDREVEIEFTLVGNEFMFSEEGNVIKSVNASHGQLVLNTPSGEHMFSELAECHEGKVVFVVTKEMIDEFVEVGFYSFQIRLYDSAEMKSRVTIPPVMNGFDIRNPIAAEDEVNVVDQGLVDYARILKDQSNEELPTFDWTGAYNKTEWEHHDVITENKMNKIEDALYSINANVKESDLFMLNALDNVKKDADKYVKEHIAEVEADVEEFERNLNTGVEKFKVDTNAAMTAHKNEVSEVVEGFDAQLTHIENQVEQFIYIDDFINDLEEITDYSEILQNAINKSRDTGETLIIKNGTYRFSKTLNMYNYVKIKGCGDTTLLYTGSDIAFNCIDTRNPLTTWNYGIYGIKISDLTLAGTNKKGTCLKGEFRYCGFNNLVIRNFDTLVDLTNDWTISFDDCDFRESNIIIKLGMQNNAISFNRCKANTSDYLFYGLQCYKISYMNGNIEGIKKAIIQTSNPNWNRITELSILDCYLENNCPLIDMTDINKFQLTGFVMKRCIINVNSTDYFINSRKFANIFYNSVISENVFYNLLGDNTLFDMGSGTLTMENNTYYYFNNSDPVYITTPFTSITYHASGLQIIQNSAYGSIHSNFLGSKKGLVLTTTEYSTSKPNYTIIYDAPLNIMKLYENGNVHFFQEVKSGPTSERPTEYMAKKGVMYFDTTLGKPIWCKERTSGGYNRWVDSDGNNV